MQENAEKNKKEVVLRFSQNHLFFGFAAAVIIVFFAISFLFLNSNTTGFVGLNSPKNESSIIEEQAEEVAAIVNGKKILVLEIEKIFNSLPQELEGQFSKKAILDNRIEIELVLQEAGKSGITIDQSEVDALYAAQEEEAKRLMAEGGFSKEEVLERIREFLIEQKFIEEVVLADVVVSQQEIAQFFEENKQDLKEVSASHILVESKEKAQDILNQLKSGADFAALAKENSTDKFSAQNGGELGFFRKEEVVKEFGDAAFSLEPGKLSDVVQTQFGFHIILVNQIKDDLESSSASIEQILLAQKKDQSYKNLISELKQNAKIEIFFEEK